MVRRSQCVQSVSRSTGAEARADALLTASWDKTLCLFDPRAPPPPTTPWAGLACNLPAKAYSFDTSRNQVVVAMGGRHIWLYDIRKLGEGLEASREATTPNTSIEPDQKRESSLKFMTRSVRCSPSAEGALVIILDRRTSSWHSLRLDVDRGARGGRVL
jgi:cell cycle arrest protein BUB3